MSSEPIKFGKHIQDWVKQLHSWCTNALKVHNEDKESHWYGFLTRVLCVSAHSKTETAELSANQHINVGDFEIRDSGNNTLAYFGSDLYKTKDDKESTIAYISAVADKTSDKKQTTLKLVCSFDGTYRALHGCARAFG